MKGAVAPFLTIPAELVKRTGWIVTAAGRVYEEPALIEGFDNATDLSVDCEVDVPFDEVSRELAIPPESLHLALVLRAGTGGRTRVPMERILQRVDVLSRTRSHSRVHAELAGNDLAESLHLELFVVLAGIPASTGSPVAPNMLMDVLWEDHKRIQLEGDLTRFPVSEVDLGSVIGEEFGDALWELEVDWTDPDAPFDSVVRLLVNSKREEFAERFRSGDPATVQVVMADIMSQITSSWLAQHLDAEVEALSEYDENLSSIAEQWVVAAFGSVENARRMLETSAGAFHARLSALARPPDKS